MKYLRNTLNCILQDKRRNEDIREELGVKGLNEIISNYRRRWCAHLQRMEENRLPKIAKQYKPRGKGDIRGRPKMRWVPEQVQQPNP